MTRTTADEHMVVHESRIVRCQVRSGWFALQASSLAQTRDCGHCCSELCNGDQFPMLVVIDPSRSVSNTRTQTTKVMRSHEPMIYSCLYPAWRMYIRGIV